MMLLIAMTGCHSKENMLKRIYDQQFFEDNYLSLLITALNASGWFMARSAKTFRFNEMLLALTFPIN